MAGATRQDDGKLHYAVCCRCGHAQAGGRSHCLRCGRNALEPRVSMGNGSITTFTTVYRPPNPSFRSRAPYVIVLVDMAEGYRLMLNLRSTQEPTIGQRVQVVFGDDGLPAAVAA